MKSIKQRTFEFSTLSINLVRQMPKDSYTLHVCQQFFRAATSIGANYREADGADSKKEFRHRISIAKKEAKEAYYWLGLLQYMQKDLNIKQNLLNNLIKEARELTLIFSKIIQDTK